MHRRSPSAIRLLEVRQYLAALVLGPITYFLWLDRFSGSHAMTLMVLLPPTVSCYAAGLLGTNTIGLWEFHQGWRIGRFPVHGGLSMGSFIGFLEYICFSVQPIQGIHSIQAVKWAFVVGTIIAFWNWVMDTVALKNGFVSVYNRKFRDGQSPEAITGDYAPLYFGMLGALSASNIILAQNHLAARGVPTTWMCIEFLTCACVTCSVCPALVYVAYNLLSRGETGLKPCRTAPAHLVSRAKSPSPSPSPSTSGERPRPMFMSAEVSETGLRAISETSQPRTCEMPEWSSAATR